MNTASPKTAVIVDIECNGRVPGLYSMLNLAAVACDENGNIIGEFDKKLKPIPGTGEQKETMEWWATQPKEIWEYVTSDQEEPEVVIKAFLEWWKSLPGEKLFISQGGFDWNFVNYYIHKYIGYTALRISGFDLKTFASAKLGWPFTDCRYEKYKPEWLGNVEHSHKAIDDARGYAHFYFYLKSL